MTTDAGTEAATTKAPPWIADASTFGARLALIRQRMGWGNVKEAAVACGLPVESWRNWERDGMEPRRLITIAMTIATRTGCDYLWLVHGPERGQTRVTQYYVSSQHVVAQIPPIGQLDDHPSSVHGGDPTRPVRQTKPSAGVMIRPATPIAA